MEKYKYYKCYPIVGRLVTPPSGLKLTTAELAKHKGEEEKEGLPEGWAAAPIYVAVKGQVFDMSFGGRLFYGPGGPYHFLAGKDGSRPLAKVSEGKEKRGEWKRDSDRIFSIISFPFSLSIITHAYTHTLRCLSRKPTPRAGTSPI